ncbi:MAG TPA: diadenylate cyclase [Gemmataceae bacterium]|jgi:DNA integrity scanning protein DisA with diadenylate cyclase activity|nr:diadenylate cyclase [Gemmataceae bacterium]
MPLAPQTVALLQAARHLIQELPADAVLLLTETDLDWKAVLGHLGGCRLLVAAEDGNLTERLKSHPELTVLEIDPGPTPRQERMSLALLEAVRSDRLRQGADVIALYNGIDVGEEKTEPLDSLSVIHLGEHLERLSAQDLRNLDTQVPLETLRAVVDLALEIGREGREGHPVGTMFVVGDTRKVLTMCRPMNFNPFRGYSQEERDIRNPAVREQIKDIAQLEGAIVVRRDGVAVAAAMRIDAPDKGFTLSMGLGTRHAAAAAVSKSTKAIAVTVSQSSGTVRLFQNGEVVLHIEPMARPMIWGQPRLETQDANGANRAPAVRGAPLDA